MAYGVYSAKWGRSACLARLLPDSARAGVFITPARGRDGGGGWAGLCVCFM